MSTHPARAVARLLVLALTATALGFTHAPAPAHSVPVTAFAPGTAATAATAGTTSHRIVTKANKKQLRKAAVREARKARAERAIDFARSRAGKPYRYGANGPRAFDCSGLVQWSYKLAGKKLPRTSRSQVGATFKVRKPRRGDLVFFHSGGSVYHVGIYAGRNKVWHASKPGVPVRKDRIWTSSVFYGRVR